MSIGMIGKAMRTTRTKMVGASVDHAAAEFYKRFGMKDGDYVEFERWNNSNKKLKTIARMVSVDACFANSHRGFTACVKVVPMLQGGLLGVTRTLWMTVNANGGCFSGLGRDVRRIEL